MENVLSYLIVGILLFVGVYGVYTCIRLAVQRTLFPNRFLYPANCKPDDCIDVPGFIRFVLPQLLVLSLVALVGGCLLALCSVMQVLSLPTWVELYLIPGVVILLFGWYISVQSRAYKRFW